MHLVTFDIVGSKCRPQNFPTLHMLCRNDLIPCNIVLDHWTLSDLAETECNFFLKFMHHWRKNLPPPPVIQRTVDFLIHILTRAKKRKKLCICLFPHMGLDSVASLYVKGVLSFGNLWFISVIPDSYFAIKLYQVFCSFCS